MSSPVKRPAVTYQRSRKQAHLLDEENEIDRKNSTISASLNPDLALQQKINDLLFSKDAIKFPEPAKADDEFDSAYIESSENAKKVHDMVQVGETRRFTDEIEYLLEGLDQPDESPKSLHLIRSNLLEIVDKCFKTHSNGFGSKSTDVVEVNVTFGMKLKAHGALVQIFESLESSEDSIIMNNLLILLCALLYDVRRLDFFFKSVLAVKLARHCWNLSIKSVDSITISRIKSTHVVRNLKQVQWKNDGEIFKYIGAWILFKWAFSGLTSTKSSSYAASNEASFLDLVSQDSELLAEIVDIFIESNCMQIKEKVAGLLDCLLNRKGSLLQLHLHQQSFSKLNTQIIQDLNSVAASECSDYNLTFAKLAVSLTGSSFGKSLEIDDFIDSFQSLFELTRKPQKLSDDLEILLLSCLINLTDRCEESFIDELRLRKVDDEKFLLTSIAEAFFNEQCGQIQKSLLALLIGFICRENRTNFQVLTKTLSASESAALQSEIFAVASKFVLQHQQQQIGRSQKVTQDDQLIQDRLHEIVLKFK